jgi:hypothetical protein
VRVEIVGLRVLFDGLPATLRCCRVGRRRYLVLAVYRTRMENFVASDVKAVCE